MLGVELRSGLDSAAGDRDRAASGPRLDDVMDLVHCHTPPTSHRRVAVRVCGLDRAECSSSTSLFAGPSKVLKTNLNTTFYDIEAEAVICLSTPPDEHTCADTYKNVGSFLAIFYQC